MPGWARLRSNEQSVVWYRRQGVLLRAEAQERGCPVSQAFSSTDTPSINDALRALVAPLELDEASRIPTGWHGIDAATGGGLHRAGVHVFLSDLFQGHTQTRHGWCPPLGIAIHLAWRALACEHPGDGRRIAWFGMGWRPEERSLLGGLRAGRLACASPVGSDSSQSSGCYSGAVDERLLNASFVVDTQGHAVQDRVWAIEQAIRCPGIAAVIADGREFDESAIRRLHVAARSAADDTHGAHSDAGCSGPVGTFAILLLPHDRSTRRCLADTRWRVTSDQFSDLTRTPAWKVRLLRARGMQALAATRYPLVGRCHLDWEEQHGSGLATERSAIVCDTPSIHVDRHSSSTTNRTRDAHAA